MGVEVGRVLTYGALGQETAAVSAGRVVGRLEAPKEIRVPPRIFLGAASKRVRSQPHNWV